MARLTLIVFSLVLLTSSASALISGAMLGSNILLRSILVMKVINSAMGGAIRTPVPAQSVHMIIDGEPQNWGKLRRRRQAFENESNNLIVDPSYITRDDLTDLTLLNLQDQIFQNIFNIASDIASEGSVFLGLPPNTLEAIYQGGKDAPNLGDVLDTIGERFHAPKLLVSGLHTLLKPIYDADANGQ